MTGLLSLPDEVIELIGKEVLSSRQIGLRNWCKLTSTCKRLWDMQLPGSTIHRSLDLNKDIEGESKATVAQPCTAICHASGRIKSR